jgi:hypothetical protein
VAALRGAAVTAGEEPGAEPTQYTAGAAGGCRVDVTDSLPRFIREHDGLSPDVNGPNCWDTALAFSHMVPGLRYASAEELRFFMHPPFCRPLGLGEPYQPGDIVNIRANYVTGEDEEYHAFIWISDQICFSKNGLRHDAPMQLQSLSDVLTRYHVGQSPICRNGEGRGRGECPLYVEYFRCTGDGNPDGPVTPALHVAWDDMRRLECAVSDRAFGSTGGVSRTSLHELLDEVSLAVGTHVGSAPESEGVYWRAALLRLKSLRFQLRLLGF